MADALDPVTAYARSVVDGTTIAAKLVRLACVRHLRDLETATERGLVWKPDQAQRVIEFFADVLCLPDEDDAGTVTGGKPFILSPFQAFIAGSLFGWYTAAGARRFRVAYVETAKGSGKALAVDTPIPTPTGWTTMGAIQPGDYVFDEHGQPTRVAGAFDVIHGHQCYEVVFDDASSIVADADHLWWTEMRRSTHGRVGDATRGVPLSARGRWRRGIRTTQQIADTLRYPNGPHQSANHSVPLAGALGTTAAPLPIEPYVLGVWLGDGDSDCARITICDADAEIIEHLAAAGASVGARKQSIVHVRTPRYRVEGLQAQLRVAGLLNNKHVPQAYLRASIEQRLALLQGLMDTDGYISPKTGACEFCTTTKGLADAARELVVSLGIKVVVRESAAKIDGREVSRRYRLQFHPPPEVPVFRLERKLAHQAARHTRRRLSADRRIVDVRPVESVPVRCIAVESASSLYLAGASMIPTHNTPFGAGILIYMAVADGERGAQCFCAAVTKDQAKLAFTDAENMVKVSPELNDLFDQKVNNLAILETGCFIRPISAEKRGLDGKRVHGALIDELHEHPSNVVTAKMRAGTKNRQSALILEITNSGFDRDTVCWEHHDMSRQILEGLIENDAWFAFICHLDACARCQKAGKYQPSDDCPDCDDWKTEGPHWLKANPNLGVSLSWQYLREQVREAVDLPSQRNLVRRLNFCQWTQQATAWLSPESWASCKGTISSASLVGRECFVGIDLSDKIDLSAVVLTFPRDLERAAPAADGQPIDRAVDVLSYFWMPEKTLARRAQEDKIPYPEWVKAGHVFTSPGSLIDHDAIVEFVIATLAIKYKIRGIGIDQAGAAGVVSKLQRHFGDTLVEEIPQGFRRLSAPTKLLEALIVSNNLSHDGNLCMNWCVGNLAIEENAWREIRPVKINQRKRIDGGVALIDALAKMIATPYAAASVYATRGVRSLADYL